MSQENMSQQQRLVYYIGIWALVGGVIYFALPYAAGLVLMVMPGGEAAWINTILLFQFLGKVLMVAVAIGLIVTAYKMGKHSKPKESK